MLTVAEVTLDDLDEAGSSRKPFTTPSISDA
jgi:hypothetical protein